MAFASSTRCSYSATSAACRINFACSGSARRLPRSTACLFKLNCSENGVEDETFALSVLICGARFQLCGEFLVLTVLSNARDLRVQRRRQRDNLPLSRFAGRFQPRADPFLSRSFDASRTKVSQMSSSARFSPRTHLTTLNFINPSHSEGVRVRPPSVRSVALYLSANAGRARQSRVRRQTQDAQR